VTSPQVRKGSTFERSVVAYLREHGHPFAERAYGAGRPQDVGDIDGLPGWTLECKAHKALALAGWIDEAEAEGANARRGFWAVIAKRRGKPTADAYVVLPLSVFARLVAEE
jgi:Holliday junction resolvase